MAALTCENCGLKVDPDLADVDVYYTPGEFVVEWRCECGMSQTIGPVPLNDGEMDEDPTP